LVALPLWLVISGGVGLWWSFRAKESAEREEQALHARKVDAASMADDVRKLVQVVGRRDTSDEAGGRGLERAAAMIEGALGPANAGFVVRKPAASGEDGRWPVLDVTVGGKAKPALWLVAAYDTRADGVEANATGVAALLAAALALPGEGLPRETRVLFVPHGCEVDGPMVEGVAVLRERIREEGGAWQVLCIEAMGAGEELWISCRDTAAPVFGALNGLGQAVGAEDVCLADDFDLASTLCEMGLPAARVATRRMVGPAEAGGDLPPPAIMAASAGRLVELARRLATGGRQ
jgi:hypothetical protein